MNALLDLGLLDTRPSEAFDRITRMASQLFGMPIAAMSLTDRRRQWFKSSVGVDQREIPREQAPCAAVTASRCSLLVPDMLDDTRFSDSPLTRAGVRFYAGAPLITKDGYGLGSLCVLDSQPRTLSGAQMGSLEDFAAMVMSQVELQHNFGRIDPSSGLPNRHQLMEDLADLERDDKGASRALLLIETTDVQHVSRTMSVLGPSYFDDILQTSGNLIREVLGRDVKLYRSGIASFVTVLDEAHGPSWRETVERLGALLGEPIWSNGIPVLVAAAFGVSSFRVGEVAAADALRTAMSAASDAREASLGYAMYDPDSDKANRRRFALLSDMRQALAATDQLSLVYQPRVDARTNRIVSAEALLRWRHPELGNVPPGEFIPLVEQTALARPVTEWVINTALNQARTWQDLGCPLRVSVNVSAHNLEEEDFADRLAAALRERNLPAEAVELEFTESALIRDSNKVMAQLRVIRETGVEIAIDDFGTGYSTFAYLKDMPATTIKLDQSFIRHVATSERDQLLVQAMIGMARGLGYRTVAEGVETDDVRDFLTDAGCDELQGYLISRPIAAPALQAMLASAPVHATSRENATHQFINA